MLQNVFIFHVTTALAIVWLTLRWIRSFHALTAANTERRLSVLQFHRPNAVTVGLSLRITAGCIGFSSSSSFVLRSFIRYFSLWFRAGQLSYSHSTVFKRMLKCSHRILHGLNTQSLRRQAWLSDRVYHG